MATPRIDLSKLSLAGQEVREIREQMENLRKLRAHGVRDKLRVQYYDGVDLEDPVACDAILAIVESTLERKHAAAEANLRAVMQQQLNPTPETQAANAA